MVMISLGANAEVDILSSEEHRSGLQELQRIIKRGLTKDRSIHKTQVMSGQFAADPLILDLGGPPPGAMWVPLWLVVCGATDTQVVTNGQAAVYFGGDDGSNPSLSNLLIPASAQTAIPFWTPISGKDDIYGHYGDHFLVAVHGNVIVGQSIQCSLRVREVTPAAVEELNLL